MAIVRYDLFAAAVDMLLYNLEVNVHQYINELIFFTICS